MLRIYNILIYALLSLFIFSCGNGNANKSAGFSIDFLNSNKDFQSGNSLKAIIKNKHNKTIDSVEYSYNNTPIKTVQKNTQFSASLTTPLGKNPFSAKIYSEGKSINLKKELVLHHNKPPKVYTYRVINSYPHDPKSFTQGLEFYKDTLYESTGKNGESYIRKLNFKTGEVLAQTDLNDAYFGEGITILNNKLYQLTWRSGQGFIYDVENLKEQEAFSYNQSKEGWGICNDGKKLYKSDGTEKIWILDSENLSETGYIQPVTHKSLSTRLNELEWVEGKIYANTWQKDGIAIINPKSGAIEGVIDFRGLRDKLSNTTNLNDSEHVLNGIAYNPNTQKLYVTGKYWNKLFEVEIVEK